MKVLVLDFDGVIADSQYECLIVGYSSYLKFCKESKLFDGKKITLSNFNKIKSKYKKTIGQYKKLRPYVIDAFCWYVMLHILENKIKIKNQDQYNKLRKKLMKNNYVKYVKYYYQERQFLQKKNFGNWIKLEAPFIKIINAIKKLEKKYTVAISTNNRKKYIQPFLKSYNINPRIICDSKFSTDKKKQITYIKNRLKAKFDDIYFVDDQKKHFPNIIKLGVKCYLALWGYNNKQQQKEAKKLGAILLKENNFYKTFRI